MLSALDNLINDIAIGPENRKVKQYLGKATRNTVYADLAKVLSWQLKRPQFFQETFDKYCIEDQSSHEKYWTEESFRNHVRGAHSAGAISDAAIALLWKSFYFYAYHPFPPDLHHHAKVDFDAFRRAIQLTVSQCDGLLGTRELDWYWRLDAACFRKASFARFFRSIAVPDHGFPEKQQKLDITPSSLSDAMDVLVMVGPQFTHAVPSEPQLGSAARKLFADGPAVAQRDVVRREDISVLIGLLLRLRLQEEKWARSYPFGAVIEAGSARTDLTEVFVDSLTERYNEQDITVQHLSGQADLMPHLLLRFQQLWAVLFQPSGAADVSKLSVDEYELTIIGGAISLFAPPIIVGRAGRQRPYEQDTRLTLEAVQVSPDSQDMTILRLRQILFDNSAAHIVLFTAAADGKNPKTVIGAYLPIKLDVSHILFQLQPSFRLLRWSKRRMLPEDLINSEEKASSEEVVLKEDLELPYWIGAPLERGAGLRVDPRKKTATLTNSMGGCYVEVPVGGKENSEKSWNITIQQARMDIFTASGAEC
ncbi:hypothetical protein E0Z10_g8334 [Xylaria hypoxylon]|uniref:TLDc domain-containing protein n=1 Tax=Xylaria hypoxylon TaxID=37992 RepID=A0A4Z0YBK0_9PEZI|nr:hypothetical protein E0Z10_g8334 [Xylaria hypoxylon]